MYFKRPQLLFMLIIGLFFMLSCGKDSPQSNVSPEIAEVQDINEADFLTEGDGVRLAELSELESVGAVAQVTTECEVLDSNTEMKCESKSSEVTSKEVAVEDGKLKFKKAGEYIVRLKKKHKKEIFYRMKVKSKGVVVARKFDIVGIKIKHKKDKKYQRLYHFDLTPIIEKMAKKINAQDVAQRVVAKRKFKALFDVSWNVEGGGHEFLDYELAYLKKLRIFKKTILFKELKKYFVHAKIKTDDDKEFSAKIGIDLSQEDGDDDDDNAKVKVSFDLDKKEYQTHQWIDLKAKLEMGNVSVEEEKLMFTWYVREDHIGDCSSKILQNQTVSNEAAVQKFEQICMRPNAESDYSKNLADAGGDVKKLFGEVAYMPMPRYQFKAISARNTAVKFLQPGMFTIYVVVHHKEDVANRKFLAQHAKSVNIKRRVEDKHKLHSEVMNVSFADGDKNKLKAEVGAWIMPDRVMYDYGRSSMEGKDSEMIMPPSRVKNYRYQWKFDDSEVVIKNHGYDGSYNNDNAMIKIEVSEEGVYTAKVTVYEVHYAAPGNDGPVFYIADSEKTNDIRVPEKLLFEASVSFDIKAPEYKVRVGVYNLKNVGDEVEAMVSLSLEDQNRKMYATPMPAYDVYDDSQARKEHSEATVARPMLSMAPPMPNVPMPVKDNEMYDGMTEAEKKRMAEMMKHMTRYMFEWKFQDERVKDKSEKRLAEMMYSSGSMPMDYRKFSFPKRETYLLDLTVFAQIGEGEKFEVFSDEVEIRVEEMKHIAPIYEDGRALEGSESGYNICTMDVFECADGSIVGRSGAKCEFQCPSHEEGRALEGHEATHVIQQGGSK